MVNNVYSIYNTLSRRYGDVVAYPSDAFASRRLKEVFTDKPELLSELELCRIGTLDIDSGVLTPHAPVRIELDDSIDNIE